MSCLDWLDSCFAHKYMFPAAPFLWYLIFISGLLGPKTGAWLAVISRCGTLLIQTPLSLSRSIMTMQRSSGRTRVCGPAGKGPTNISSSTAHSSKSPLFTSILAIKHTVQIFSGFSQVQTDSQRLFSIFLLSSSLVHTYTLTANLSASTLWGVWVFCHVVYVSTRCQGSWSDNECCATLTMTSLY